MRKLTVIYKDPKTLKPRPTNPRTHSKRQIEQLKKSIQEFGFVRPVLLDGDDGIIAGHGSTLAAVELGMTSGSRSNLEPRKKFDRILRLDF